MALETTEIDTPPNWGVIEFIPSAGHTSVQLIIIYRGTRLHIYLFEEAFFESPQLREKYLLYVKEYSDEKVDRSFWNWIVEPFYPLLRNFPSPAPSKIPTLKDYVYAETLTYMVGGTASGERVPYHTPQKQHTQHIKYDVRLPDELCEPWPRFHPSEIKICANNLEAALSSVPKKVQLVNGSEVFFLKLIHYEYQDREFRNYKMIADAGLDREEDLRISHLEGFVQDERGVLLGLLFPYINGRNMTLMSATEPYASPDLRRRWADQVTSTVKRLHAAGAVWGDARASNVLIDADYNAWVTGFDVYCTEGLVDDELAGTVEGDLQGLAKIMEHLGKRDQS
ncbi:uncharacterized protein GGS25DRAFT_467739 [Hypoxylon fragiforme]|uniref:uncharacterized protein n=1 Tax=Hypoxylon fragiforme TaxID=63214 RepID=UPI0020C7381D|nr:uncharacterized protein GGS25DRAFT_467739 [Hypoxylon fragiforme]KAI2613570.1 hypothetical protein GGS25DRAFT_467739 [Hypoxylon fragiforme]